MAIPARLTRVLQRVLGDEGGDDLVTWMAQVDANRSELRDVMDLWTARVDARFAEVDARFAQVDARFAQVDSRFAQVDARFDRVDARFSALEKSMAAGFAQMNDRMAGLEVRMERRATDLLKWSFVFWCGAIGATVLSMILNSHR
jgi:hypothetical protein